MNLVNVIEHLLFEVASGLYLPVIAGCALLVGYVPIHLGFALFEALQRWRGRFPERERFAQRLIPLRHHYASTPPRLELEVERLLQAEELRLSRQLDRVRFVIKVGPALGLMGTLIPMGISLAALAEGNIPKMAGSMVTAFTATVAGLGSGVLAYLITLARERWVRADVREMAHAAELAVALTDPAGQLSHHLHEEAGDALAVTA